MTANEKSVDELISGFHAGELIIIGGKPASGKTTLGLNIARRMGLEMKKTGSVFQP